MVCQLPDYRPGYCRHYRLGSDLHARFLVVLFDLQPLARLLLEARSLS